MGLGIWTMHFIGTLALHFAAIPVNHNLTFVLFSILSVVGFSGMALYIACAVQAGKGHVVLGALFLAVGMGFMHYIGMEAFETEGTLTYRPLLWIFSAIASFFASVAFITPLTFVSRKAHATRMGWRKARYALMMGLSIAGIHYLGMSAANYKMDDYVAYSPESLFLGIFYACLIGIGMLVILGLVLVVTRIDKQFESKSIEVESKLRSLIESANDAIILTDCKGTIFSWNKGAQSIFGYEEKEAMGQNIQLIIPERFREAHQKGMERYLSTGQPVIIGKTIELQGIGKNGKAVPIELSLSSWQEQGDIYFSSIIRDITERKQAREKISQMVYLDPLTGLPNRSLLHKRLDQSLAQAAETKQNVGILFIDLDRFKFINDTLGHTIGDELLIEVGKRIQACVGKNDTVFRQGGDEFIVLLPNTSGDEAAKKAKQIVEAFGQSIYLAEHELFASPSIGIALYPEHAGDKETLIQNADTAMYRVKEQGKNGFQFYVPEMNETISKKMQLENGLRKALERDEFKLLYQPKVDVQSRKWKGAEALIRWQHPVLGNISPAEFIPMAEETGLIIPIGEWVLREACRQNKTWQQAGFPPLRMAVNISSRQFQQIDLIDVIQKTLKETGLDPQYLELELTESLIQNSKHAIDTMHQLKEMGIHLSIDDFGTGYSSLSYLKAIPIDTLKIDQSFIRNCLNDPKDASLVETIIHMAHNLELNVIAEGVETEQQLRFLQERHCNEAQGYYFSRPISAEEMAELMKEQADF